MNWSVIIFFLFLFSLIVLVVGTKNPKIIFPKSNISRVRYFLANLFITFLLLSISVGTNSTSEKEVSSSQQTPILSPEPQHELLGESIEVTSTSKGNKVKISNVIDGDTVKTENGEVIRLIGIDAPEISIGRECFAKESTEKLEELILNKEVDLEKDISETDRYKRLLRYIWIGEVFINEIVVREGFAKVSTYPPDVKYQTKFQEAESLARQEGRGLWGNTCNIKESVTSVPPQITTLPIQAPAQTSDGVSYVCDCSKTCSRMSCAEAQYQLTVCGCGARDADKDGIACDSNCQ